MENGLNRISGESRLSNKKWRGEAEKLGMDVSFFLTPSDVRNTRHDRDLRKS
jgi:hypothetical protein